MHNLVFKMRLYWYGTISLNSLIQFMAGNNEDLDKNTIFSSLLLMLNGGETWLDLSLRQRS